MSLGRRAPYVVLLAVGGTLLGLAAWGEGMDGNWVALFVDALYGLILLAAAGFLALRKPGTVVPEWAQRFELVAVPTLPSNPAGQVLRCNRCDATVIPQASKITLPRLLTYAYTHTALACDPRRATDPEDTDRIGPERHHRALRRRP